MGARIVGLPVSLKKPHKYRAKQTVYNGVSYDSKAEAARAAKLDWMSGEIRFWIGQPKFRLGCPENVYVPDFLVCLRNGDVRAEDVKGFETAKFRRDKKLWAKYGPCDLWIIWEDHAEVIEGGAA